MHNIPDKKELDFADGYILHDIIAGGLVGVSALPIVSCIFFMLAEGAAVIEFFYCDNFSSSWRHDYEIN